MAELMRELGEIEGLHWMRILYAYPSYFTDELIEEIASNPKVTSVACMPLATNPGMCRHPLHWHSLGGRDLRCLPLFQAAVSCADAALGRLAWQPDC